MLKMLRRLSTKKEKHEPLSLWCVTLRKSDYIIEMATVSAHSYREAKAIAQELYGGQAILASKL